MENSDRLIRMRELSKMLSMSRANIYLLMSKGKFPKNFKLGEQLAQLGNSNVLATKM
jgi:predicted DNA-binding transcriptional regulator AlpA